MFKRSTLLIAASMSVAFTLSCASKKKVEPIGMEHENGKMDDKITSSNMAFDEKGSDGGNISGLVSVHFDYDSATLSSETRREIGTNADWIKAHPNVTIQIEGHCDSRGSVEYNLALGERRAKSVKAYMTNLGIDAKRMTIISYGEEKPVDPADNEQAYAKNRRANFVPLAQ